MPTKRKPIARLARPGDMDPAVADYLLRGDHAAALADMERRGVEDVLILWLDHELAELWMAHETELLAEARRRGIRRPWWLREERLA